MATHILVVDDETAIADLVEVYLKNEGFTIHKFYNASDALACVRTTRLDLAVLDVMLPDMDGFTLCQRIREDHLFPIIMLTAKVEDMDKIMGLTLGADDYITKPFNPLELVARVKTQLRRYTRYNPREGTVQEVTEYDFRGLQISKATHKCVLFGEELALTPLEFSILWYLCEHQGNVVSSEELFEHVWGEAFMDSNNTVMSHIARLREKMHEPSRKPKFIKTVWGWGTPLSKKGNTRSRRRSLRIWGGYLLVLMAWVVAVMALAFLGFIICASITWQPSPLYDFLNWVRDYIVLVCIVTVLAGWVVISFYFISKPIKQLDVVANAAEQLSRPSEEPIQLPDSLEDISIQLNLAREQALRDARAAREAEQRKNDLIVYLAHDLKTPLTSVIGYLTLLRDEPQISPEIRARYTGIALEKAERLEDLINEFFDITRFNLSRLELERQSVDLTRMLEQVASEFRPIFAESGLSCSLDLPPKLHYSCDPDKLARVFDNLLRNASYYSLPDSTVEIAGRIEAGKIVLTFSNAGKNIPQEKLDRIFEQFFRLDSSRATRTGGAGLGLAIAKEIVELHGGTIRADSTEDRITFTICLPSDHSEAP